MSILKHNEAWQIPRQPERSSYDYSPCLCVSGYWFSSKFITRYHHPICTTPSHSKKSTTHLSTPKKSTTLNSFKKCLRVSIHSKLSTTLHSFKKMSTCLRTHLSRRRQYRYMFRHKTFPINWHIWQCLLLNNVHIHVRITVMISSSRLSHRVCQNNRITWWEEYFIDLFLLLLVNSSTSSVVPTCSATCLQLQHCWHSPIVSSAILQWLSIHSNNPMVNVHVFITRSRRGDDVVIQCLFKRRLAYSRGLLSGRLVVNRITHHSEIKPLLLS